MFTLCGGPTPDARKIAIALGEMSLEWLLETMDILAVWLVTPSVGAVFAARRG